MFVGGFSVKVSRDIPVIEKNVDIKKGYRCEWIIGCKLDGGVNAVKVRGEGMEVVYRMFKNVSISWRCRLCNATMCVAGEEHVIKRLSQIWRGTDWRKKAPFWFPWLYRVSVGSVVVECEAVHCENHTYEVTESLCTNSRTIAVACVKEMSAGGNSLWGMLV